MPAAEAESMLAAEAEAEAESMREAEEEEVVWDRRCRFRHCLCPWEGFSLTSLVAPGEDYLGIPDPAAADLSPAWSLLVGVTDGASSLQVSRLRVARCGLILGRSDDVLEAFHKIVLAKPPGYGFEAGVAPLDPDGRSLCLLHDNPPGQPHALQLSLHPEARVNTKELPLPEIEGTSTRHCHCIPISAGGHIWALSARPRHDDIKSFSVLTQRLVPEPGGGRGRWELVGGGPFTSPLIRHQGPWPDWRGSFLQGYAVLGDGDANLILVSFQQHGLFLTFAPDSGRWTRVLTDTDEKRLKDYLPIFGRGTYVEQHKAVYMLHYNTIYAYKLTYQQDDQGIQQLKLDTPIMINSVCPFIPEKGYGFLTRLGGGRLMCSVWISLAWHRPCPCNKLHAIVTTFDLGDDTALGGIKVLHSTYRQLDMRPNPQANQKFCFLQEYEDQGYPVLQQREEEEQEDLTSSQHVDKPSKMLSCCRYMLECRSLQPEKPSSTFPRFVLIHGLQVDPPSRQHQVCSSSPVVPEKPDTTTIKKDLFIICQAGSRSVIYQTGVMDDIGKPLEPCYAADVGDHCWHFFQCGSKIHAVSSTRCGMLEFSLNKDRLVFKRPVRRPTVGPFVMVIRVGRETIALTETLQVYHQTQFNYGPPTWLRYLTDESDVVGRRVNISGYVVLNDDSFIVWDAVTCSCLLFDLVAKQWRVVMPWAAFKEDPPKAIRTNGLLNGRCVFVDGFIYTCRDGGLAAYELLRKDHSVYLSKPIILPLSGGIHCVGEDMCLDYAGNDVSTGANLFYVVQDERSLLMYGAPITAVNITTVKVKTEETASNKMKPAGIHHMGSVRRVIHHTEAMNTRCCFAVS